MSTDANIALFQVLAAIDQLRRFMQCLCCDVICLFVYSLLSHHSLCYMFQENSYRCYAVRVNVLFETCEYPVVLLKAIELLPGMMQCFFCKVTCVVFR